MSSALVRNPGDGTTFSYHMNVVEQVVSNAETSGLVSVTRQIARPDQAPPLHTHSQEDESWIVLSGRVRFWVGSTSFDECEVYEAEPGAFVWGPRSVPHSYQAITSTAELLVMCNPGAIEGYFREAGATDSRSDAPHSLMEEYGFVIHGNPPPVPETY
ncbi:cupin domain-containing protein [Streptomyces sp. NPDC005374]|uniref:cupin domain-containing protein n=1 Tax=Streptomyces sp. NPDC005374 TaxID=3364713 RepID=UPI0036880727